MKKRFVAFLCLIMSLLISSSAFSGCNLVTTDNERDMKQIVATVNINNEEHIYKQDMIMAYLNYGYMYVQYYSYTQKKTFELILDNLISSRIMVQNAVEEYKDKAVDTAFGEHEAARYLTAEQKEEAEYNTYKAIADLLDGYTDDGHGEAKSDSLVGEVRTVPTDAANAEKEVDKAAFIAKQKETDFGMKDANEFRREAFNKVISLLKNNSLLGDDYDAAKRDLTTTEYFKQTLKNQYESQLLTAYNEEKTLAERKKFSFSDIENAYKATFEKQTNWTNAEFVAALSSATASDPILCCGYQGYGYVYNLLLGANDYQTAEISKLKTDDPDISDENYSESRAKILAETYVTDQRSSWILSGYDFDGAKFTGDYTFAENADNSLAFQGTVAKLADADEDKGTSAQYSVTDVTRYKLDEFITFMDNYVYGEPKVGDSSKETDDIKKYVNFDGTVAEYDNKIQELLFAFSTDSGSLNKDKGYVIKPAVDAANSEEFVKTFADAGRELLTMGGKSYMIVASDYGYHVMFYSQVVKFDSDYDTLTKYLDSLSIDKGELTWEQYYDAMLADYDNEDYADNYLYLLTKSVIDSKVTAAITTSETEILNKYRYDDVKVTVFESVYKELLG